MAIYENTTRTGNLKRRLAESTVANMASRIGNIVMPRQMDGIWAALRKQQATAIQPYMDPGSSPSLVNSFTESVKQKQRDSQYFTQQSLARQMGMSPLSLNQVMPARGIASPTQMAQVAPASNFKSEYVDDRDWGGSLSAPRTLAQIIGSGMLTPQQIQNASINNVLSLFKFTGGTEQQRLEMGYFLQRFILDGYIRGVDVYSAMKTRNAKHGLTEIFLSNTRLGGVGVARTSGEVGFRSSYWNGASDKAKFQLFYHEFAHYLLNAGHQSNSIMGPSGISASKLFANYDYYVNALFSNSHRGTLGNWGGLTTPSDTAPGTYVARSNPVPVSAPAGYPSLGGSGAAVPPPAGGGTTGGAGGGTTGGGGGGTPVVNPTTGEIIFNPPAFNPNIITNVNNPPIVTPPTLTTMGGGGMQVAGGSAMPINLSTPRPLSAVEQQRTPTITVNAGMSQDSLLSFQAGLADAVKQAEPMLRQLGGALARLKTG